MRQVSFSWRGLDGVLNADLTTIEKTKNGFTFVEDRLVEKLRKIIDETGAQIILSSDWRFDAPNGSDFIQLLNKLADFGLQIEGMTGDYAWRGRGEEITEWLFRNTELTIDECIMDEVPLKGFNYVILDDLPSSEFYQHSKHLVHTNCLNGLTDEDVEKAIQILNSEVENG